jgi:hypothetical protein
VHSQTVSCPGLLKTLSPASMGIKSLGDARLETYRPLDRKKKHKINPYIYGRMTFFFETRSCSVAQSGLQLSCLSLPSAGIIGMHQHM